MNNQEAADAFLRENLTVDVFEFIDVAEFLDEEELENDPSEVMDEVHASLDLMIQRYFDE